MPVVSTAADGLKCSLAADVLRGFGELRLQVAGASMLPALWPGDILTLRPLELPHALPGDIVLFLRGGRFFAHRVLEVRAGDGAAVLVTRGDAMPAPDPPVSRGQLLGRVIWISRRGREFEPRPLSRPARLLSWLLRRWDWPAWFLFRMHALWRRLGRAARHASPILEQV